MLFDYFYSFRSEHPKAFAFRIHGSSDRQKRFREFSANKISPGIHQAQLFLNLNVEPSQVEYSKKVQTHYDYNYTTRFQMIVNLKKCLSQNLTSCFHC